MYRGGYSPSDNPDYPWRLHVKLGSSVSAQWNIPTASGNHLFGLDLPDTYALPPEPYRSLRRFKKKHARIFFGRGREIRDLFNLLVDRSMNSVILFYGQSGIGKSSLLEAGLIPRIEERYFIVHIRREGLDTLDRQLAKRLEEVAGIKSENLTSTWKHIESKTNKALIVILDQVEEIYTRPQHDDFAEFDRLIEQIREVFVPKDPNILGKILLSYRKEYHADVEQLFLQAEIPFSTAPIDRLDSEGIIEAVEGVTKNDSLQSHFRLSITDTELPAMIADDLEDDRQGAIAPVLQILLYRMWTEVREQKRQFTTELYRDLKTEGLLLDDFLTEQLSKIEEKNSDLVRSGLALNVLNDFTTVFGTSEQHTIDHLLSRYGHQKDRVTQLCHELEKRYLLNLLPAQQGNAGAVYRLSHDILAPVVRRRYEMSDSAGKKAIQLLANLDTDRWKESPEDHMLNVGQIEILDEGQSAMPDWTDDEKNLIDASKVHWNKMRRRSRRLRGAIILLVVVAACLAALWISNLLETNRLQRADTLEARADGVPNNPTKQLQYLSQARLLEDNDQRRQKWFEIHRKNLLYEVLHREDGVTAAAVSRDGRYVALATRTGLRFPIKKFELKHDSLRFLHEMQSTAGSEISQIIFSANGEYIIAGGADRRIHSWKLNGDSLPNRHLKHKIDKLTVGNDRQLVAVSYSNLDTVDIWNVFKNERLHRIRIGHFIRDLRYSPNDEHLIIRDDSSGIWQFRLKDSSLFKIGETKKAVGFTFDVSGQLWANFQDRRTLVKLSLDGRYETSVSFIQPGSNVNIDVYPSQYGRYALSHRTGTAIEKSKVSFWEQNPKRTLYEIKGHRNNLIAAGINEDSAYMLTVDAHGSVYHWPFYDPIAKLNAFVPKEVRHIHFLENPNQPAQVVGVAPRKLVTCNLKTSPCEVVRPGQTARTTASVAEGSTLLLGDRRGNISFCALACDQPQTINAHPEKVIDLAISHNERWAISVAQDRSALLWNAKSNEIMDSVMFKTNIRDVEFVAGSIPQKIMFVRDDSTVLRYGISGNKLSSVDSIRLGNRITGIMSLPDEENIFAHNSSDTLLVWDGRSGHLKSMPVQYPIRDMAHSQVGGEIICGILCGRKELLLCTSEGNAYFSLRIPAESFNEMTSLDMNGNTIAILARNTQSDFSSLWTWTLTEDMLPESIPPLSSFVDPDK